MCVRKIRATLLLDSMKQLKQNCTRNANAAEYFLAIRRTLAAFVEASCIEYFVTSRKIVSVTEAFSPRLVSPMSETLTSDRIFLENQLFAAGEVRLKQIPPIILGGYNYDQETS